MKLELKEITFIIVSYKANKVIYNCINSLPKFSKIIVIESSYDQELKRELESKYDNIEVILNENLGMGASNNIGIKKANTKFAFILNPDVVFNENTFFNLVESLKNIDNFSIISPINENKKYPNYEIKNNYSNINSHILEVDSIDGYSMLIDKSKFENENYFDENFFLYLEEFDLCKRLKKYGYKIYKLPNFLVKHLGGKSHNPKNKIEMENQRNWHYLWSLFYFTKKYNGYPFAFLITFRKFISALIKLLFFYFINKRKHEIYKHRFLGLLSSYLCLKANYRA